MYIAEGIEGKVQAMTDLVMNVQGPGTVSELITQHLQSQSKPAAVHLLGACTGNEDSTSEASASAVQSLLSSASDGTQVNPAVAPSAIPACRLSCCFSHDRLGSVLGA